MNVVKEIERLNERELQLGSHNASWHDQYKDSAYIFVGGLNFELTEGDVITIFSQYGEVMDVNLPREKETGKTKGFGFLMYEDARSCVLAVDNLNGAKVLERTLRVDHVQNYRQGKVKGEDGEMVEREEPSMNARPDLIEEESESESEQGTPPPEIDPEDPMYEYLMGKWKEEREKKKKKSTKKIRANETPEERKARKARKKAKKEAKARKKGGDDGRSKRRVDRGEREGEFDRGRRRDDGEDYYRDRARNERSRKRPRSMDIDPVNAPRRRASRSPPRMEMGNRNGYSRGDRGKDGYDERGRDRDRDGQYHR